MNGLFSHSFTCVSLIATIMAGLAGCDTESHQGLAVEKSAAAVSAPSYTGPKHALAVGKFDNREVIGFGETSGYDSTLNGKVLDLAIR